MRFFQLFVFESICSRLAIVAGLFAAFLSSSCTIERLFPDDVANGVARLSVNNFGNLLRAVSELPSTDSRPECNLRSLAQTEQTTIQKDSNEHGTVTWKFSECEYDFGERGTTINTSTTCGPGTTTFYGKVKITGSRTIAGFLPDNKEIPVIPTGQKGVSYNFSRVTFQNYRVETSGTDKAMTIVTGSAAFKVNVHLAEHLETNLCTIPLSNLTLSDIQFSPGQRAGETIVRLPGLLGEFQAIVNGSNFQAQVGIYQDAVNRLEGTINVWGDSFAIPTDKPVLDPSFSVRAYEESLTCTPGLKTPVSYHCPFETAIASGIARLTVNNLGNLVRALNHKKSPRSDLRPECDLHSFAQDVKTTVLGHARKQGEVVWEFDDCEYDFGARGMTFASETNSNSSCKSETTTIFGKVRISGRRRASGFLTGNKAMPVIPGADGIDFNFTKVAFENYRVESSSLDKAMAIASGSVSFDAKVHLAKSSSSNMCTVPLPNLTINNIRYSADPNLGETKVLLLGPFGDFKGDLKVIVDSSDFRAQVGKSHDQENLLEGTLSVFGSTVQIPTNEPFLDPNFDDQGYDDSLKCTPDLQIPVSFDCDSFERFEATTIARLLILNLGTITQESSYEYLKPEETWHGLSKCGFSSNWVRAKSQLPLAGAISGEPGAAGQMQFHVSDCDVIMQNKAAHYPEDCLGYKTVIRGKVRLTGTQTVEGIRENVSQLGLNWHGIAPNHPRAISFDFEKISPSNFSSYYVKNIQEPPIANLVLKSGTFSAKVMPILAPKKGEPCRFERSTPVVGFDLSIKENMPVDLVLNLENFDFINSVVVNSASLKAQNGFYQGEGNYLDGKIKIDGQEFDVRSDLSPRYDQKDFDASYACRRDTNDAFSINSIIPPEKGWKPDCKF